MYNNSIIYIFIYTIFLQERDLELEGGDDYLLDLQSE